MKKIISYCFMAIFAFLLFGCEKTEYKIELQAVSETIAVGETTALIASVTPEKEGVVFSWSSGNNAVATVDDQGIVTGVSTGQAEITVTVEEIGSESITITVNEREISPSELKTLLQAKYNAYLTSLKGSAKIELVQGTNTLTSELIWNFSADAIDSLMYKLSGSQEGHVYVKEGFSYMLFDEIKNKSELTAAEVDTILNQYGFEKFSEAISEFYYEDAFFNALSFKSRNGDLVVYELTLGAYEGTVFDTAGKDSIVLNITLANDEVAKVETVVTKGTVIDKATLNFISLTDTTITYPSDLETYE